MYAFIGVQMRLV